MAARVVALLAVAACAACGGSGRGHELVLRAAKPVTAAQLRTSAGVMRARTAALDVPAGVRARGADEVVVELRQNEDLQAVADVLGARGALAVFDFERDVNGTAAPTTAICPSGNPVCAGQTVYAFQRPAAVSAADVVRSAVQASGTTVALRLTAAGSRKLAALVRRAGPGDHLAIVFDGTIRATPPARGLHGLELPGLESPKLAERAALELRTGTMPVRFAWKR